jgi:hypothetical protein
MAANRLNLMNSPDLFFALPLASKFHRREAGTGFLQAANGSEVGCRFVLEQTPAGGISLRCLLDTVQSDSWRKRPIPQQWYDEHKNLVFDLETESGYRLENLRFYGSGGITTNGERQSYEFDLSHLELRCVRSMRVERPLAFIEFSVVNFQVDGGNAGVRFSNVWYRQDNVVVLHLGDRECWLHPVENSADIVKELKANKGVDVTATFTLPFHSLKEWNAVEARVDKLCTVLTLLSGNRVTWISARALDSWGYTLSERWRNSVTNPYTTNDILNTLANDRVGHRALTISYVCIIERMMSRFDEAEQKWNIRAAINTWHETVISDHFFEQRGLLIGACMEMLRTSYLKHQGRQTILDSALFDEKWEDIRFAVEALLCERFPSDPNSSRKSKDSHRRKLHLMSSHVRGLNYPTFADSLQKMARELEVKSFTSDGPEDTIEERWKSQPLRDIDTNPEHLRPSIRCFVRIRDFLTHQGAFFLTAKDQVDDQSEFSENERQRQLEFLQRFTASFLCSALGWQQPLPAALELPE